MFYIIIVASKLWGRGWGASLQQEGVEVKQPSGIVLVVQGWAQPPESC